MQTFKDLRKVITQLGELDQPDDRPPLIYDEKRIFLLDDSPLKAVNQPWNQLVVPEYDKPQWNDSKDAIQADDLEGSKMDRILLAVIGILEELKTVENLPAWVRSGGLMAGIDDREADQGDEKSEIESAVGRLSVDPENRVSLDDLPSHAEFTHWYSVPKVVDKWVSKGKAALEARGIEVDHGLKKDGRGVHQVQRAKSPPGHYPSAYRPNARAWSPSVPNSPAAGSSSPIRMWSPSRPANEEESFHQYRDRSRAPSSPPFSRRGMHTQLQDYEDFEAAVAEPSGNSAGPSHELNPVFDMPTKARKGGDRGNSAQKANSDITTKVRNGTDRYRGAKIDSWRTFKAIDVSTYLSDVADRILPNSSNQQDLERIRFVAEYLFTLALREDDGVSKSKNGEMCVECNSRKGEEEGKTMMKNQGDGAPLTAVQGQNESKLSRKQRAQLKNAAEVSKKKTPPATKTKGIKRKGKKGAKGSSGTKPPARSARPEPSAQ